MCLRVNTVRSRSDAMLPINCALTNAVKRVRLYQRFHRHELVPHTNVRFSTSVMRAGSSCSVEGKKQSMR